MQQRVGLASAHAAARDGGTSQMHRLRHGRIEPPGTIAVCVVAGMVEQVIENAWRDPIGVVRLPHDIWDSK